MSDEATFIVQRGLQEPLPGLNFPDIDQSTLKGMLEDPEKSKGLVIDFLKGLSSDQAYDEESIRNQLAFYLNTSEENAEGFINEIFPKLSAMIAHRVAAQNMPIDEVIKIYSEGSGVSFNILKGIFQNYPAMES